MAHCADFVWSNGERNRKLDVYRPCPCGTCSAASEGIGYLSWSDASGCGFSVQLENELAFQMLGRALAQLRGNRPTADADPGGQGETVVWMVIRNERKVKKPRPFGN
jgi:hypothetical protein